MVTPEILDSPLEGFNTSQVWQLVDSKNPTAAAQLQPFPNRPMAERWFRNYVASTPVVHDNPDDFSFVHAFDADFVKLDFYILPEPEIIGAKNVL